MSDNGKDKLAIRQSTSLMPMGQELTAAMEICKTVHAAGMLPAAINSPEKAFAIWLYGRELGIGFWTAVRNIYPTSSKDRPGVMLSMSADLMLGIAKKRIPGFQHGQASEYNEKGEFVAATFWSERPGNPRLTTRYTLKQAAIAGYTTKNNWAQNPELMCIAAAKRSNVRTMAADVLAGIYTPDELGAEETPTPKAEVNSEIVVDNTTDAEYVVMAEPTITNTEETTTHE